MIFTEHTLMRIAIFLVGICGFLVASHIYRHKKSNKKPLICPVGFDCNAVVHSDYSKFMGIPVEVFGMIYYALIALTYLVFVFVADMPFMMDNLLVGVSLAAFLFSLYLLAVQKFVLRKGCSWCILSAFISAVILILVLIA